ncbi:M67 family metallopeptidase [Halobacteria archaeon AArc-curdl1]|uniref:M67 family metallopeptidase n=1 Tax=Natronosalvus hydrolyticus TaxID=2979988 RepID=A0AAP3E641_9EURY|nr:M67 family metallopeptidase [Halobacteria archaeon AArc-curdl1]
MTDSHTPQPVLVVPDSVRKALVEAARDAGPEECCGVLGGAFDPQRSRVTSWYPAANAADQPRERYLIDPTVQLEIFERLEDSGEDIVGFYHSHPRGPPVPSQTDVDAAAWPDRSYVIVVGPFEDERGSERPAVRSWRWRDGGETGHFERERLESPRGGPDDA